jgi:glycosyltransferase involved in cell wall biosynthesis
MKSTVIVPTYNERENIVLLVPELLALPVGLHIIIVDDNSPDSTGLIADEMAAHEPRLSVIHRPGKLGLGTAYIAGFKQALATNADRILTMDADYSHHPRYIPGMIARSASADLVIGSRYVRDGGALGRSALLRLVSYGGNAVAKLLLGLRANDCTAGFRCYRREVLETIDLDTIFSNGYSFLIEMLYRVQRQKRTIVEVPICYMDRQRGQSKISRNEIRRALYTVLRLSVQRVKSLGQPNTDPHAHQAPN